MKVTTERRLALAATEPPTYVTRKLRAARFILWLGAFMPIIYSEARTVEQVGGVGLLEVVRGGGPILAFAIALLLAKPVRKFKIGVPEIGIIGFLAIAVLSPLWAVTAPFSAALKSLPLLFAYLCVARVTTLYRSSREMLDGLATAVFLIMLSTLLQWAALPELALSGEGADSGRLQSIVPRISANLLGVVAAVGAIAASLRIGPRWARPGWVRVGIIAASVAILFATQSRFATAAGGIALVVVIIVAAHRTMAGAGLLWISFGIGFVALAVAAQTESFTDSIAAYVLRDQTVEAFSTLTGRTVAWDYALLLVQERPMFGHGYYVGTRLVLPSVFGRFAQYNYSNIDSTWLETAVNVGWVGVVFLAIFVAFGTIRVMRTNWGGRERWMPISIMLIAVALSFINPGVQAPSVTLVLVAACVFASRRPVEPDNPSRSNLGAGAPGATT